MCIYTYIYILYLYIIFISSMCQKAKLDIVMLCHGFMCSAVGGYGCFTWLQNAGHVQIMGSQRWWEHVISFRRERHNSRPQPTAAIAFVCTAICGYPVASQLPAPLDLFTFFLTDDAFLSTEGMLCACCVQFIEYIICN